MFRAATERELICLLQAQDHELPAGINNNNSNNTKPPKAAATTSTATIPATSLGSAPQLVHTETSSRTAEEASRTQEEEEEDEEEAARRRRRILVDEARSGLLELAFRYLLKGLLPLREKVVTLTGQAWDCSCTEHSSPHCVSCRAQCSSFADGCLMVLERDFVQLLHGELGILLDNRPGVRFLLAGTTLGLLYEGVAPKTGIDEAVLTCLVILTDTQLWARAITLYGTAPKRRPISLRRRRVLDTLSSLPQPNRILEAALNSGSSGSTSFAAAAAAAASANAAVDASGDATAVGMVRQSASTSELGSERLSSSLYKKAPSRASHMDTATTADTIASADYAASANSTHTVFSPRKRPVTIIGGEATEVAVSANAPPSAPNTCDACGGIFEGVQGGENDVVRECACGCVAICYLESLVEAATRRGKRSQDIERDRSQSF
eukprot:UC1_evm1s7